MQTVKTPWQLVIHKLPRGFWFYRYGVIYKNVLD
jgi:hypothetical protein